MKGRKKSIACLLSFVLIVTAVFGGNAVKVFAEDVTNESYDENHELVLNSESTTLEYATVTVPEGYHFVIDNVAVTVTTIDLKKDACLEILGTGTLECTTWNVTEGARMSLDKNTNIPSGIDVYDELPNEQGGSTVVSIKYDNQWNGFSFLYNSEGKWVADHSNDNQNNNEPGLNWNRLQYELNSELFAFGAVDGDNDSDKEDLKYGIAKILYQEFGQGNRYQREGEALGISDFNSVLNNMTVDAQSFGKISVYKKDSNTSIDLNGYNVTFTGTETATSENHTFTAKVYLIDETNFQGTSDEQVIIKVNNKYFIRDAYSREENNEDELEEIEGANARALVIVSDFDNKSDIKLFGNFATGTEEFSDESTQDMFSSGFSILLHEQDDNNPWKDLGDKFIVMKPKFTGFTLTGSASTDSENESLSPLAWSSTGSFNVTESNKDNANVDLYFGYDTAKINPTTTTDVTGLDVKGIESVKVSGDIPSNAVEVSEKDASGNYKITFKSNYYDTVPIEIVYEKNSGGTITKKTTINRVGIVIEGGRTAGGQNYSIHHGHDEGGAINSDGTISDSWDNEPYGSAVAATYYYPATNSPSEANVSLYVTITYTDGTVEQKIVETTKFTPATNESTAMSDYVLFVGSSDNQNYPVKVEAIAVPNADANGRFVGAKLGAGKGVTQTFDWSK